MGARDYYGENNAWVYRWDVQHNAGDLVELMGGKEAFVRNLDATFNEWLGRPKYEFYAQLPDHTGNVGQYSMGTSLLCIYLIYIIMPGLRGRHSIAYVRWYISGSATT